MPRDVSPVAGPMLPSLATLFAGFGAAAGLFAILGLGAFRDAARHVSPLTPMVVTAVVGAGAGEILRRWRRLHGPNLVRDVIVLWVTVIAGLAGATSGAIVALVAWGTDGVPRFFVGGAAVGLAFAPSCLVVFDAAKRAERARQGSLVAATDRRTVLSTVFAAIAFASTVQIPALLSLDVSDALTPFSQTALSLGASVGATIAILELRRRDRKGRAVLASRARDAAGLELAVVDDAEPTGLDLGLGTDRWSQSSHSHYRASGRPDVVLRGSFEEANAALDEGERRRHRSLVVTTCALSAATASVLLDLAAVLP